MFTLKLSTDIQLQTCPPSPPQQPKWESESVSLCPPSPTPHLSRVLKSLSFPSELQITWFEVASSEKHPTAAESWLWDVAEERTEELLCQTEGK